MNELSRERTEEIIKLLTAKFTAEAERLDGAVPYIAGEDGKYTDVTSCWWTNGF